MTFSSFLLALVTAVYTLSSVGALLPILLGVHSDQCGLCLKIRPTVKELSRSDYPVNSVDIDQNSELAGRYRIPALPTIVAIDRAGHRLARTKRPRPAAELARLRGTAVGSVATSSKSNALAEVQDTRRSLAGGNALDDEPDEQEPKRTADVAADEHENESSAQEVVTLPDPWKTAVRIRVLNSRSVRFGSGTIISSTPEKSIILTCAHIFRLEGCRQAPPAQFPRQIMIDLFDGDVRGTSPVQVHCTGSVEGNAVDYDFGGDVGLVRIRPGRRLPAARVVPTDWQPQARMKMLTVGCSEGHDATAWHTTIVQPRMHGVLSGNSAYEAIECLVAPIQGRSGGGLFTTDGYVAGVCNFAEPQGDHGLYATPRSIYSLLDRNHLMALYARLPNGPGMVVADRGADSPPTRTAPISVARSDSSDHEGPVFKRPNNRAESSIVMIPPPGLLGIRDPISTQLNQSPFKRGCLTKRFRSALR
jgi:hypothetical protein